MARNNDSVTIRSGSFVTSRLDSHHWEFTCDWLPPFRQVVRCSQSEAGWLVVTLQTENRKGEGGMRVKIQSLESEESMIIELPNPTEKHPAMRYERLQDSLMDALNALPAEQRPTWAFTWSEVIEIPDWWMRL